MRALVRTARSLLVDRLRACRAPRVARQRVRVDLPRADPVDLRPADRVGLPPADRADLRLVALVAPRWVDLPDLLDLPQPVLVPLRLVCLVLPVAL